MKRINLGTSHIEAGEISLGCMRMNQIAVSEAAEVIERAYQSGIDLFDHADIYGKGEAEKTFADAFAETSLRREDVLLQSKCGIREGMYDFSKDYILSSVDGILQRLGTDYLDTLLLHRPDALMEPDEVAEAFHQLEKSGKVKVFGVSNQNPVQMALLAKTVDQPLQINQLQLSLVHTPMIDAGFHVNMADEAATVKDGGILEYCRLYDVTVQAWSPFQHGMIEGVFIGNNDFPNVNEALSAFAEEKNITASAAAIAWILRHPAQIQPVIGSMNPQRIEHIAQASEVDMTRAQWYELYRAAGNDLP
ncbi:aldo/keto reductase [Salisediminibacterium halotolerans]|uniref:Predicted oxidoreductase n=1 Tax=Salisediminibacterium halotolerans TaxID=517425 RepID=A0A1H9WEY7_9BACI|nr:aldo/keto reductase [Salisediminibacterium haloalkalitolerans]SES32013.1 Predicted oxidoreductase [Salisediminibacterium haloalkalitolerans]